MIVRVPLFMSVIMCITVIMVMPVGMVTVHALWTACALGVVLLFFLSKVMPEFVLVLVVVSHWPRKQTEPIRHGRELFFGSPGALAWARQTSSVPFDRTRILLPV